MLQRYLELEEVKAEFTDHSAYKAALKERPQNLVFQTRHMKKRPEPYDEDIYPKWPKDGLQLFYCRLPSANASSKNR